jgi:indole-3-glycerol phosphate synthase
MSHILDKIIDHKRQEVQERKELFPAKRHERSIYFETPVVSLREYLQRPGSSGVIAEFKRRSPSQQNINLYAEVEKVSIGYMQAGAAALSVLTDEHFFGGKNEDLSQARQFNFCPILRKDFIIDEYQIVEARGIGADAILLIAACLEAKELQQLARFAKQLGLEVVCEVHDIREIDKLCPEVDIVGVNNRNLHDFSVSIQQSIDLYPALPGEMLKISESGIEDPHAIVDLKRTGYQGFLIGTYFMRNAEPERRCRKFIDRVRRLESLLDGAIA